MQGILQLLEFRDALSAGGDERHAGGARSRGYVLVAHESTYLHY
jgi:hypothetical protein